MTEHNESRGDNWKEPHVALGCGITDFKACSHDGMEHDASVFWWVWGVPYSEPAAEPGDVRGPTIQLAIRIDGLLDTDIHDFLPGYGDLGVRIMCNQHDAIVTLINEVSGFISAKSGRVKSIRYGKFEAKSWDRYTSPK